MNFLHSNEQRFICLSFTATNKPVFNFIPYRFQFIHFQKFPIEVWPKWVQSSYSQSCNIAMHSRGSALNSTSCCSCNILMTFEHVRIAKYGVTRRMRMLEGRTEWRLAKETNDKWQSFSIHTIRKYCSTNNHLGVYFVPFTKFARVLLFLRPSQVYLPVFHYHLWVQCKQRSVLRILWTNISSRIFVG